MDHVPRRVMDWLYKQETISTHSGPDSDSISDINIANYADSDGTITEESMGGSIVQRVGGNGHAGYMIENGEFIAEVDFSMIGNVVSNRDKIYPPSSDGSSDDDSWSVITDVESEDRGCTSATGMRIKHQDMALPQLVSTTLDHHILQHRSNEQPVAAVVTTSVSSTFPNQQRYKIHTSD
jgi:hypothetical protein